LQDSLKQIIYANDPLARGGIRAKYNTHATNKISQKVGCCKISIVQTKYLLIIILSKLEI